MDNRQDSQLPSPEAWADWKLHPVTQLVQAWAAAQRAGLREDWERGAFTHERPDTSAVLNAKAIGMAEAFALFEELNIEQFQELENGE